MTEYAPTPELGLILPIPETGQIWRTDEYIVNNFQKVDARFSLHRGRLEKLEQYRGGTTAERATFYGADPTTPTDRATFAKTFPQWFNEEKGYWQQYFCQFDDVGVTATTPARSTAGWGPAAFLGLVPLKPTAVTPGAGTAVLHGGKVVYTAASVVRLDGIFSADFENYRIIIDNTAKSAAANLVLQLSAAGVGDVTPANYTWVRGHDTGAARTVGSFLGTSAGAEIESGGAGVGHMVVDLFGPNKAAATAFHVHSVGGSTFGTDVAGAHAPATAQDGVRILPVSGTMTGTIRIYGYNDY